MEDKPKMSLKETFKSKTIAQALKKKAANMAHAALAINLRTADGLVTPYGVRRIKVEAKLRPALARGFFAASKGQPFTPIGGPIDLEEKNHAKIAAEALMALRFQNLKTDLDRLRESEAVPLDDAKGFLVELPPRSSVMCQVRLADLKEAFIGRRRPLKRSVTIAMMNAEGNPDLWMTTEEKLDQLGLKGIPGKDHHVWHSKEYVSIKPTHPNNSKNYYMVITSGIQRVSCRVIAFTEGYIPTITSAIEGTYRPSIVERATEFGKTVIQLSILESDVRRSQARSGCCPLAGYPLPHSMYGKKGSDPTVRPLSATEKRNVAAFTEPIDSPKSIKRAQSQAGSVQPNTCSESPKQLATSHPASGSPKVQKNKMTMILNVSTCSSNLTGLATLLTLIMSTD
jgi:hypothetical protein